MLANPDRVVVDLFGAKSGIAGAKQSFAEGVVSQARIGEHPDKVRVVLDLRVPTGKPTVVPTANGVRIELGQGDERDRDRRRRRDGEQRARSGGRAGRRCNGRGARGDAAPRAGAERRSGGAERPLRVAAGRRPRGAHARPQGQGESVRARPGDADHHAEGRHDRRGDRAPRRHQGVRRADRDVLGLQDARRPEPRGARGAEAQRAREGEADLGRRAAQDRDGAPRWRRDHDERRGSAPATDRGRDGETATPDGAAARSSATEMPTAADAGNAPADAAEASGDGSSDPAAADAAIPVPTEAPAAPAPIKTASAASRSPTTRSSTVRRIPRRSTCSTRAASTRRSQYQGRRISLDFKDADIAQHPAPDRRGLRPERDRGPGSHRQGDDPPGGRALGSGARRDPADQGPGLRAHRQHPAHRAGRDAQDRSARPACRSAARARSSKTWS